MDKQTGDYILKKAKKYKKWGEGMLVNPFYWVENGVPYYVVVYLSRGKSVASAFFSTQDGEVKEEALRAHPPLAIFSELSTNIFNIGEERAAIGTGYFMDLLAVPFLSDDEQAAKGREVFADLSKYQQEFIAIMKDFTSYYDDEVLVREKLEQTDIDHVQKTVITLQLLQYKIGVTVQQHGEELKKFEEYLQTREEWQKLAKDKRAFIKGMLSNLKEARKELDALNVIEQEDPDTMFQLNYDRMLEESNIAMESQKKYIRFPK
ncbi:hypothetical protein [Planococcus versutus]|uniref:Uncharacterized protein n=1 Tax=Planococcus versutus TaxID=1302659 RepID=A0A1B1RZE1_9BACL|nr:hypothetical protein [Planococcus versutus]ANU26310.1 hypothetical protein I858_004590 [Planococcus versutus]